MFTNVGWGEILVIFIIGLIFVGPERLPKLIQDLRAALIAARTAIDNAKSGLDKEFGPEFDEFRKPLSDLATLQRMGPRAAIAKTLLDGDDTLFDSFDPKKIMNADTTAGNTERARAALHQTNPATEVTPETHRVDRPGQGEAPQSDHASQTQQPPAQGSFSWEDIT